MLLIIRWIKKERKKEENLQFIDLLPQVKTPKELPDGSSSNYDRKNPILCHVNSSLAYSIPTDVGRATM